MLRAVGPLPDHDVEGEIFQGGVEDLLDAPTQAVNLVDEQHIVLLEVREDRRHVARSLDGGARRDADVHPHLRRDDVGERRLAQAGRPVEQHVVQRLLPLSCRQYADPKVVLNLLLADVLLQRPRTQGRLGVGVLGPGLG